MKKQRSSLKVRWMATIQDKETGIRREVCFYGDDARAIDTYIREKNLCVLFMEGAGYYDLERNIVANNSDVTRYMDRGDHDWRVLTNVAI